MIISFYLILFLILSISGKDKKKDSKVIVNFLLPKLLNNKETDKSITKYDKKSIKPNNNVEMIREIQSEDYNFEEKNNINLQEEDLEPISSEIKAKNLPKKIDDIFKDNKDWKIQDESEKDNYKQIAESKISASNQKSFDINLEEAMILKYNITTDFKKTNDKDLSKKENHDIFFDYYKYEDKLKYESQINEKANKTKIPIQLDQTINQENDLKKTENLINPKTDFINNLKISVSFVTEKKKKNQENNLTKEFSSKKESKLRQLKNFSFKNTQLLLIDDKYFLDSFFPFFSIVRYKSKTNPKLKRILILSLTFQYYMFLAAFFYNSEVIIFQKS